MKANSGVENARQSWESVHVCPNCGHVINLGEFLRRVETGLKTQRPLDFQPGENHFDDIFSILERDLIMVPRGDLNVG